MAIVFVNDLIYGHFKELSYFKNSFWIIWQPNFRTTFSTTVALKKFLMFVIYHDVCGTLFFGMLR